MQLLNITLTPGSVIEHDGIRYEPTGEYRKPQPNEPYLSPYKFAVLFGATPIGARIILRPVFVWPDWLQGWGIAKDVDGHTYLYEYEASLNDNGVWGCETGRWLNINSINRGLPWWDKSLSDRKLEVAITDHTKPILNPNYKKPE